MLFPILLLAALSTTPPDSGRQELSRVWIEGGSNVHDWTCRAEAFDAKVQLEGPSSIRRVTLRLNARDLKCGNRKMEHDLYAALKATDPSIPSYIVAELVPRSEVIADGTIEAVGVEKPITIELSAERLPGGSVKAAGAVPMRMTDFGITPPTGLFGLIRSRNEITVKFDLVVGSDGTVRAR